MLIARFDLASGRKQTLREHSENVSRLCGENLAPVGLDAVGRLVGLVHDLGKAKPEFQTYIESVARGENVEKGSVIHSTAGMCYIASLVENKGNQGGLNSFLAELCEYVIGAHHGIFDCIDPLGNVKLFKRLAAEQNVDATVRAFFNEIPRNIDELIRGANEQFESVVKKMRIIPTSTDKTAASNARTEQKFYIGMLARLVLSALVDADRRDSADFCSGETKIFPPAPMDDMAASCERVVAELEATAKGRINEVRRSISLRAANAGILPSGAYRLNLPCGAGKTVASIRFALAHARAYGKRRIFYVAPLLTILDQNVATIRKLVGDNGLVLEHTSDFDEKSLGENEAIERRLVEENWSCPVVATSMVRFLETLFSSRGSSVRRLNSLAQSVIIIDEVQALPVRSITMFNAAVNFLTRVAGATVLLCTATLPTSPDLAVSVACRDTVVLSKEEQSVFSRCNVVNKREEMTYEELCSFAVSVMNEASRLLFVCNTKREAAQLFRMLSAIGKNVEKPFAVVHLSAAMCKAHRGEVLKRILTDDERLVCVSTQVIEAGVDISFECVVRLAAGIDNIAQAAGRCNRNGEFGTAKQVYVVRLKDEKLGSLVDIKRARRAYDLAIVGVENFDSTDNELINNYYREYYRLATDGRNETLYPENADGVNVWLYDLLSANNCGKSTANYRSGKHTQLLDQAFGTAGKLYRVIDDDTYAVIVPYNDSARKIISDLCSGRAAKDPKFVDCLLKEAKPYVISVGKAKLNSLVDRGAATMLELFDRIVYILGEGEYDGGTGLLDENTIL